MVQKALDWRINSINSINPPAWPSRSAIYMAEERARLLRGQGVAPAPAALTRAPGMGMSHLALTFSIFADNLRHTHSHSRCREPVRQRECAALPRAVARAMFDGRNDPSIAERRDPAPQAL